MKKNLLLMLMLMFVGIISAQADGQQLAFPGADGYGKYVTGGRGGKVYYVTRNDDCTDNDLVVGTLRWALRTGDDSPRIILFQTSGTIYLTSKLKFAHPNVSILGQTAPGGGICIAGYNMYICKDNVIIRHVRFRAGDIPNSSMTGLDMENCKGVILDHCSMTWSMEESLTAYDTKNTTVQWCIIGEALYNSKNSKGARSYAMQWGGEHSTMHHTLITNSKSRSPRFNGVRSKSNNKGDHDYQVDSEFANNVVFNSAKAYGGEYDKTKVEVAGTWTDNDPGYNRVYMINNYYKPGPCTKAAGIKKFVQADAPFGEWYLSGNKFEITDWETEALTALNSNNYANFDAPEANRLTAIPYTLSGMEYESADNAYQSVITKAGASLPRYDEVDARILAEAAGQKEPKYKGSSFVDPWYGIIDAPDDIKLAEHDTYMADGVEYTNYPFLGMRKGEKYMVDSDADGMPDAYEDANGFNKNNAADGAAVAANGYTNLENYLNGVADGTINKADYETSDVMIPAGDAANAPTETLIKFDANGAVGNMPANKTVPYGTTIILPSKNTALYMEGHTMKGWKAGNTRYAFGAAYVAASDATIVPYFEANKETLADRENIMTITWDFTAEDAPQAGITKGAYVTKVTPKTEAIDMGLVFNEREITVPSEKGTVITVNGAAKDQIKVDTDGKTFTFTISSDLSEVTSISVTLPAPNIKGNATATWKLQDATWASSGSVTPEIAGTVAATVGNGLKVSTTKVLYNKASLTTFLAPNGTIAEGRTEANVLSLTFTPTPGLEFTADKVTFRTSQTGTNGKIDVTVKQGNGEEQVLETGLVPGKAASRNGVVTNKEYNLAAVTTKSDAPITVNFYIYGIGTTDKLGIGSVNLSGAYDGVITGIEDIPAATPVVSQAKTMKYVSNGTIIITNNGKTYTIGGIRK